MRQSRPNYSNQQRPCVVGTGLIALDVVVNRQDQARAHHYAGGTCGNVLTILSFLGWAAYPVSRLNRDITSRWVLDDLKHWGVHTDYASLDPTGPVPVIIEWITEDKQGRPSHRYSFVCPTCGSRKPAYKPVHASAIQQLLPDAKAADVYFFDRVSKGALLLARHYRGIGALVVFEPSGVGDPKLFREALSFAHVVKYSSDRMSDAFGREGNSRNDVLLEIETCGETGLRFRSKLLANNSNSWGFLPAFPVPKLKDAAGSGDWFTAAFLDRVGRSGLAGFLSMKKEAFRAAMQFAGAAASWSCNFEAPRGGMYSRRTAEAFAAEVEAIVAGCASRQNGSKSRRVLRTTSMHGTCPKCHGGPFRPRSIQMGT